MTGGAIAEQNARLLSSLEPGDGLWLTVVTGSMSPAIKTGERVRVVSVEPGALLPGDIVVRREDKVFVVHRFQKIEAGMMVTKGDRNATADRPARLDHFVGRVDRVAGSSHVSYLTSVRGQFRDARLRAVASTFVHYARGHSILARVATRLSASPLGRTLLRVPYAGAVALATRILRRIPGVRAAYLIHGGARGDIVPGLSDIDLLVVLRNGPAAECAGKRNAIISRFRTARRFVPVLGHVAILSETELGFLLTHGGVEAYESPGWKLLFGEEARKSPPDLSPELLKVTALRRALDRWYLLNRDLQEITRGAPSHRCFLSTRKHLIDVLRLLSIFMGESSPQTLRLSREEFLTGASRGIGRGARLAQSLVGNASSNAATTDTYLHLGYELLEEWNQVLGAWSPISPDFPSGAAPRSVDASRVLCQIEEPLTFEGFLGMVSQPCNPFEGRLIATPRMLRAIAILFPEFIPDSDFPANCLRVADLLFPYSITTNAFAMSAVAREILQIHCALTYGVPVEHDDDILRTLDSHDFPFILEAAVILSKEVTRLEFERHLVLTSEIFLRVFERMGKPDFRQGIERAPTKEEIHRGLPVPGETQKHPPLSPGSL